MSYYNVLHFKHTGYGFHIDKARDTALLLGYPFFMWNDRIYNTANGKDSGLTIHNMTHIMDSPFECSACVPSKTCDDCKYPGC